MPFIGLNFFTLLTTLFWVWMLVDCLFSKSFRNGSKVGWLMLIFFTHWIGALIYYFIASSRKNPVDALNYYIDVLNKFFQQRSGPFHQPPAPPPAPSAYPHYQQGYQIQAPAVVPAPERAGPTELSLYQVQPEYDQPTVTYPEMPMQEQ